MLYPPLGRRWIMAEMDGKDIEWMKNQIKDIGHDTDDILEDTHMNDGIDYGAIVMRSSMRSVVRMRNTPVYPMHAERP